MQDHFRIRVLKDQHFCARRRRTLTNLVAFLWSFGVLVNTSKTPQRFFVLPFCRHFKLIILCCACTSSGYEKFAKWRTFVRMSQDLCVSSLSAFREKVSDWILFIWRLIKCGPGTRSVKNQILSLSELPAWRLYDSWVTYKYSHSLSKIFFGFHGLSGQH